MAVPFFTTCGTSQAETCNSKTVSHSSLFRFHDLHHLFQLVHSFSAFPGKVHDSCMRARNMIMKRAFHPCCSGPFPRHRQPKHVGGFLQCLPRPGNNHSSAHWRSRYSKTLQSWISFLLAFLFTSLKFLAVSSSAAWHRKVCTCTYEQDSIMAHTPFKGACTSLDVGIRLNRLMKVSRKSKLTVFSICHRR